MNKLFKLSSDLMCIASTDGYFKELNPAWEKMLGYTLEELLQRPFVEFIHPDDVESTLKEVNEQAKGKAAVNFINRYRCKDGSYKWLEWHSTPAKENTILYAVARDITEKIKIEQDLKFLEAKYHRFYNSIMDAFAVVDMKGKILECNEAYRSMLGYEMDQLKKLTYSDLTPVKWHAFEAKIIQEQVLRCGHSEVYEKEYCRKNGEIFPIEIRTFLICDEEGKPVGMWGIVRDITQRKKTESRLKESESRYHSLFAGMQEGFALHEIICDGKGKPVDYRFLEINPAFENMTGMKAADIINRTVKEVLPNIESYWIKRYGKVALTGTRENFENYSKDIGKYFKVIAFSPEKRRFAVFFEDITEFKQEELRQKLTAEILEILNSCSVLAHAIKRILAVIKKEMNVDAVAVRLRNGEDYPYYAQNGFLNDFLSTENTLTSRDLEGKVCRDKQGNICLECMCGLVISGKADLKGPSFTKNGSFWANNSLSLLEVPADRE
ncbi:MAG: PAS domain-containing protein [Candidatus Omnitrophica bacterium]|nr:PAS domain-containing protein [Candidatus Omnitrophota bacterium]